MGVSFGTVSATLARTVIRTSAPQNRYTRRFRAFRQAARLAFPVAVATSSPDAGVFARPAPDRRVRRFRAHDQWLPSGPPAYAGSFRRTEDRDRCIRFAVSNQTTREGDRRVSIPRSSSENREYEMDLMRRLPSDQFRFLRPPPLPPPRLGSKPRRCGSSRSSRPRSSRGSRSPATNSSSSLRLMRLWA